MELNKYKIKILKRELNQQKKVVREKVPAGADKESDLNKSQISNQSMSSDESEYLPSPTRKKKETNLTIEITKIQ